MNIGNREICHDYFKKKLRENAGFQNATGAILKTDKSLTPSEVSEIRPAQWGMP